MKQFSCAVAAGLLLASSALGVEVLSAKELASHCSAYAKESTGTDGEFCARYIQGFIDGAIATDARVMLNVEEDMHRNETYSQRAIRMRAPNLDEYQRAARYAEFCLGDPVPLQEVVTGVVSDLQLNDQMKSDSGQLLTARDVVYASLKKHYPCESE